MGDCRVNFRKGLPGSRTPYLRILICEDIAREII